MPGPSFLGAGPLLIDSATRSYFLNGRVGIGTTTPEYQLEVSAVSGNRLAVRTTSEVVNEHATLQLLTGSGPAGHTNALGRISALITQANPSALKTDMVFYVNAGDNQQEKMRITSAGAVNIPGTLTAANNIKVWESNWFSVAALGQYPIAHSLGVIPKGVIVLCGASASPTEVSAIGPSVAHWHNWAKQGDPSQKGDDIGAFVRMTSTQVIVRAGNKVGWHSGAWQASGWYKVIGWA